MTQAAHAPRVLGRFALDASSVYLAAEQSGRRLHVERRDGQVRVLAAGLCDGVAAPAADLEHVYFTAGDGRLMKVRKAR